MIKEGVVLGKRYEILGRVGSAAWRMSIRAKTIS